MRIITFLLLSSILILFSCSYTSKNPSKTPNVLTIPTTKRSVPSTLPIPSVNQIERYKEEIANLSLLSTEILKSALLSYEKGELTDNEIGRIRSANRQVDLDLKVANSVFDLFQSDKAQESKLVKSISDLRKSVNKMNSLWIRSVQK